MYYIKQIKQDDCGFACIKMMLATHFKNKDYLFIPNKKSSGSYSYKELISVAKEYGLVFNGIKVKDKSEIINQKEFPFIVTIKEAETSHAVIVTKVSKRKVVVFDPFLGHNKMSIDTFIELWDGSALIVKEEVEKTLYPEPLILFSNKEKILSHILQLLSSIFCIVGIYFLGDEKSNVTSLIFMVLFIVFEIFSRINTIRIMKKMDASFLEAIDSHNYKNEDLLMNYERYKKSELTSTLNITFSLLVSIFLIFITIMNGLYNLIFIGVTILVSLIKNLWIDKKMIVANSKVSVEESFIHQARNIEEYKISFNNLHDKSYDIGLKSLLTRYSSVGAILLAIFFTMIMNKLSSATYLVFYSTVSIYLYEQLNIVFSAIKISDEYRLDKCKLITSLRTNNQKDKQ